MLISPYFAIIAFTACHCCRVAASYYNGSPAECWPFISLASIGPCRRGRASMDDELLLQHVRADFHQAITSAVASLRERSMHGRCIGRTCGNEWLGDFIDNSAPQVCRAGPFARQVSICRMTSAHGCFWKGETSSALNDSPTDD